MIVNGVPELWRLQWKALPKPVCDANALWMAITCPCQGFAYGEAGQLDLVRLKNESEIDRLELTPLFERLFFKGNVATVQRWEPREKDFTNLEAVGFESQVHSRPVVKIMNVADYNHDGQATEFFLQTGVKPCGKVMGIVVGVTKRDPRLHVFGTVLNPNKPLVLQRMEWVALLTAAHPGEILDWPCGDHGSESEVDLDITASNGEIQGIRREYACTEAGIRGKLLSEQPF